MKSGALRQRSAELDSAALRSGPHSHAVRRALRRGALCRPARHPGDRDLPHVLRGVPAPLRAAAAAGVGRALARSFTRSQGGAAGRDRGAVRADARAARRLRRDHAHPGDPHRPAGGPLPAGRWRAFSWRLRLSPPIGRCCCMSGAWRTRRTSNSCCMPSSRCAARAPDAMLVIAGEGPAREHLQSLVGQLGIGADVHFIGYLDRERGWPTAMRRPMCSCSPRAPKPRDWCCSRRWRRAGRWSRPRTWARHRSCRRAAARAWRRRSRTLLPRRSPTSWMIRRVRRGCRRRRAALLAGWASNLMARRLAELYRDLTHQHVSAAVVAA
jgi:hypothetical protein